MVTGSIPLVVFDPFIKLSAGTNENDNAGIDEVVSILAQLGIELDIAVDYLLHTQGGGRAAERRQRPGRQRSKRCGQACRFVSTQLPGASFSGCKFDYATFERTFIDARVLDTECPGHENLRWRFARTLRINFQQLGDAAAVNKAMKVELGAAEIHLKKAWQSNESYYRSHHAGFVSRATAFVEWVKFKALDFVWGNGENLFRLFRSVLIILALMTVVDAMANGDTTLVQSYFAGFGRSFEVFFGS